MTRLFAGTPFDIPPTCDLCGHREEQCVCTAADRAAAAKAAARLPAGQQRATVAVQKRPGGRRVTVVSGLTAAANDYPALLSGLQAVCGSGGTAKPKHDVIELQGDHADKVRDHLRGLGYRV